MTGESEATFDQPAADSARSFARARKARPRWETACFSSAVISANVRPSPSAGTNNGS